MTPWPVPAPAEQARYGARRPVSKGAWALAIVLHAIVVLLLVLHRNEPFVQMSQQSLKAFLLPKPDDTSEDQSSEPPAPRKQQESQRSETVVPPPPPAIPAPEPPKITELQMPFLQISRADFAASNIGNIPSRRPATNGASGADQKGGDGAGTGTGTGPGGAILYAADWFREPTDSELGGYIRPGQPTKGWGRIACKTVARYRVEECYVLGESPMGSGFGRSVLNAAWQFQVQPPRINGRPQVGSWVSIHITYGVR
jgi:hypothetical protein